MNNNQKLACAIAAVLGACGGVTRAATATDTDTSASGIEEIVVTAQRRSESIQNVPITIQAITGEQLSQLNVTTFDDVLKYLPNVTFSANGHGHQPDLVGGHFDYPPTAFTTGSIGNRLVNCLSAQQQRRFRTGYEHRPQDIHDLAELDALQNRPELPA